MIKVYELDNCIADIELVNDDKIKITSFDGDWVIDTIKDIQDTRELSDSELYHSLEEILTGRIWAVKDE